jgi:DNA mismatch repair protein MutS
MLRRLVGLARYRCWAINAPDLLNSSIHRHLHLQPHLHRHGLCVAALIAPACHLGVSSRIRLASSSTRKPPSQSLSFVETLQGVESDGVDDEPQVNGDDDDDDDDDTVGFEEHEQPALLKSPSILTTKAPRSTKCKSKSKPESSIATPSPSPSPSSTTTATLMAKSTPAMRQYFRMKEQVPGFLLLFRMGDFYEMFYDDAIKAAAILDITLTSRNAKARAKQGETAIPMCGIPHHALDNYLERLIRRGVMVAVCDQVVDAKHSNNNNNNSSSSNNIMRKNGKTSSSEGVMAREIVRLVTPGTLTDDRFLHPRRNNFLAALSPTPSTATGNSTLTQYLYGLAYVDVSTGAFQCSLLSAAELTNELYRLNPSEIVIPDSISKQLQQPALQQQQQQQQESKHLEQLQLLQQALQGYFVVSHDDASFSSQHARSLFVRVQQESNNDSTTSSNNPNDSNTDNTTNIDVFLSSLDAAEIAACGGVLGYVESSQKGRMPSIALPRKTLSTSTMSIDRATRNALELSHTIQGTVSMSHCNKHIANSTCCNVAQCISEGDKKHSVLWVIDKTVTGPGARLLASNLHAPLLSPTQINQRLDVVEYFVKRPLVLETLRSVCIDRSIDRLM